MVGFIPSVRTGVLTPKALAPMVLTPKALAPMVLTPEVLVTYPIRGKFVSVIGCSFIKISSPISSPKLFRKITNSSIHRYR